MKKKKLKKKIRKLTEENSRLRADLRGLDSDIDELCTRPNSIRSQSIKTCNSIREAFDSMMFAGTGAKPGPKGLFTIDF
jgi:predicted RNase H-like nuclease (RuvC/YqgF family)